MVKISILSRHLLGEFQPQCVQFPQTSMKGTMDTEGARLLTYSTICRRQTPPAACA